MADVTSIDGETMLVVLGISTIWGEQVLKTKRASNTVHQFDVMLQDLADDLNNLRAKYEAGDRLNHNAVANELMVGYRGEVNKVLEKYRVLLFKQFMQFIGNPMAVNDMLATYGKSLEDVS
jgi:hypothetical protein